MSHIQSDSNPVTLQHSAFLMITGCKDHLEHDSVIISFRQAAPKNSESDSYIIFKFPRSHWVTGGTAAVLT